MAVVLTTMFALRNSLWHVLRQSMSSRASQESMAAAATKNVLRCVTDVNKLVNISLFRIINIKNVRSVTFFIGKMCNFATNS